jgi:hypothetical protein
MGHAQPTLDNLVDDLKASIAMLLEALKAKSALILLYSAIDILGALDSPDGVATRATFRRWADRYMKPATTLGCSSLELYSARCGLLHNLSPTTNLTRAGVAREFIYASDRPTLPPGGQAPGGPFILHAPWLWVTFRDGASRFVVDVMNDASRSLRVDKNLAGVYFDQTY